MSALSSGEYLTGEDLGYKPSVDEDINLSFSIGYGFNF